MQLISLCAVVCASLFSVISAEQEMINPYRYAMGRGNLAQRCRHSSSSSSSSDSVKPEVICRKGPRGERGPQGFMGPIGFMGYQGADGLPGANAYYSALASYINVYTDIAYVNITDGSAIPLDKLQAISSEQDFTFDNTTYTVTVLKDGVYMVTYQSWIVSQGSPDDAVAMALFVNGTQLPVTQYMSSNSQFYIMGQALIALPAGSILDLRNVSQLEVNLKETEVVGSPYPSVKATILMVKVSNSTALISDEFVGGK